MPMPFKTSGISLFSGGAGEVLIEVQGWMSCIGGQNPPVYAQPFPDILDHKSLSFDARCLFI